MNENLFKLFNDSKSILIVLSKTAHLDSLAAGLALSIAITKEGKNAILCTESKLPEGKNLIGFSKIKSSLQLGGNILKISLPYNDGAIDKVTYNITDDRFNLLVEPKKAGAPLESDKVKFSYTGGSVDLIVTIDAPSLEALGDIYLENPDIFVKEKIINIDRRFDNKNYGIENLIEKQFSSTSEIVLKLLQGLRIELNTDIATNLYAGVASATNNFTSFSTNAQTFEVVSYLLRNGAKKINLSQIKSAPTATFSENSASKEEALSDNPFSSSSEDSPVTDKAIFTAPSTMDKSQEQTKQKSNDSLKPDIFLDSDLI